MAVGDIPTIPREQYPRMRKLIQRVRDGDTTMDDFKTNLLKTLGRVRVDSSGITAKGDFGAFELDQVGLKAILDSVRRAAGLWPMFEGREFLLKKPDGSVTKFKVGVLLKRTRATDRDLADNTMPMIELLEWDKKADDELALGMLESAFEDGMTRASAERSRFKIHRFEEMMGWFGEGWENFSQVMGVSVPALILTQKFRLDRINDSMPAFWDSVFTKCGV